jgi:hypothetical protein
MKTGRIPLMQVTLVIVALLYTTSTTTIKEYSNLIPKIFKASENLVEGRLLRMKNAKRRLGSSTDIIKTATGIILEPDQYGIKLEKCKGDCDSDLECMDGLKCFPRLSNEPVPGCPDIAEADAAYDFCYDPTDNGSDTTTSKIVVLMNVGNDGVPADRFPLGKCEGHCSGDFECQTGLTCFTRSGSRTDATSVPGCSGILDDFGTQHCYNPSDPDVVQAIIPLPTSTPKKKPAKQPVTKPVSKPTKVEDTEVISDEGDTGETDDGPQAINGADDTKATSMKPTIPPSSEAPTIVPTPSVSSASPTVSFPDNAILDKPDSYFIELKDPTLEMENPNKKGLTLGRCEGDCDGDSECEGDLICYNRDLFNPVPGCSGDGYANSDYCIDARDQMSAYPPTKDSFRLKKTWKEGYRWQEEIRERNWCLTCDEIKCEVGRNITIQPCNDFNTFFEFTGGQISGKDINFAGIKIAKTSLCIELVSNRKIEIQGCNSTSRTQKFNITGGRNFEIIPSYNSGCLTQQHVPRNYEPIFKSKCAEARRTNTSLFHKYLPAGITRPTAVKEKSGDF